MQIVTEFTGDIKKIAKAVSGKWGKEITKDYKKYSLGNIAIYISDTPPKEFLEKLTDRVYLIEE